MDRNRTFFSSSIGVNQGEDAVKNPWEEGWEQPYEIKERSKEMTTRSLMPWLRSRGTFNEDHILVQTYGA